MVGDTLNDPTHHFFFNYYGVKTIMTEFICLECKTHLIRVDHYFELQRYACPQCKFRIQFINPSGEYWLTFCFYFVYHTLEDTHSMTPQFFFLLIIFSISINAFALGLAVMSDNLIFGVISATLLTIPVSFGVWWSSSISKKWWSYYSCFVYHTLGQITVIILGLW